MSFLGLSCQSFASNYEFAGFRLDPPLAMSDFELVSNEGEAVRFSQLGGQITLITFGYTFCPDVCPMTLGHIKQAMADLTDEQRQNVKVVFISVDPERDTPEVLNRYLSVFDPNFVGLTGEPSVLESVMAEYGVFAKKEVVDDSVASYLVSHTARIYLVGSQRQMLLQYGFDPAGSIVEDLQSDLNYLLQQENF